MCFLGLVLGVACGGAFGIVVSFEYGYVYVVHLLVLTEEEENENSGLQIQGARG